MSPLLRDLLLVLVSLGACSGKTANPSVLPSATCASPFVELGGGCYYFHTSTKIWQDARDFCQGLGATVDLATIEDCHQHKRIWQHISVEYGNKYFFLGASDLGQEGSWHWVTGEAVAMGLPFWYPAHPFNNPDNDCMATHSNYGYFIGVDCEVARYFICQQL